jgi:hypothetical protein
VPSIFISARAQYLIDLNMLVDADKDEYGDRYLHLMETPKDRDQDIARDAIGYMAERYEEESGDAEAAAGYASDLCSLAVLPFGAISEVPLPKRGDIHSTGAALVSAISERQALMETVAVTALEIGTEMGKLNKAAASRMSTPQKKAMAKEGGLKKTIAELSKPAKDDTIEK